MNEKDYYKKYCEYKHKYLELKKTLKIKNNEHIENINLDIDYMKSNKFIEEIKKLRNKYFGQHNYESGGIINISKNKIQIKMTDNYDKNDGSILYPKKMLDNIDEKIELMWHTHNLYRKFKCEPPSGADFIILLQLAHYKNKYPFGIALHDDGFWVYKIKTKLTQKQKEHIDEFINWMNWMINTLNDIYCNPDENIIKKYHKDDLKTYNITKIKTLDEYYNIINNIFHGGIFVEFIPYEIKGKK